MKPVSVADMVASRVVLALEDERTPFAHSLVVFGSAVVFRGGVRLYSGSDQATWLGLWQDALTCVALALCLVLVLRLVVRVPLRNAARVVLPSFLIMSFAPLADTCTPAFGTKVSIGLALVGGLFYFRHKNSGLLRGALALGLVAACFWALGAWPSCVKWLGPAPAVDDLESKAIVCVRLLSACVLMLGCAVAALGAPSYFRAFFKDLRWLRVAHYLIAFALGIALAVNEHRFCVTPERVSALALLPLALLMATLFSVVTNNLADIEIDRISNASRPLFRPDIDSGVYAKTAWPFLGLALYFSAVVSLFALLAIATFIATYFIYSMPPFRFKRVLVLSKSVIAINTLALIVAGYAEAGGQPRDLPVGFAAFVLGGFTLVANFIDLKDYEGDKANGIRTLPALIGLKPASVAIGTLFALGYPLAAPLLDFSAYTDASNACYAFPLAAAGLVQYALINRKRYDERPVFAFYLVSMSLLVFHLLFVAQRPVLESLRF